MSWEVKAMTGTYIKKYYVMEKIGLAIRDELNREHTVLQCEKRKD
jgi:hypothetical protein